MIPAITKNRWKEAQAAEIVTARYDYQNSLQAYARIFDYLGMGFDQHGKTIVEIGCGGYPATSFCKGLQAIIFEPLHFETLEGHPHWIRGPFEDYPTIDADEVWLFNVLQHVRDPELVVAKAKDTARTVRYFEPVDYGTCIYHPHTFSENDFRGWFGESVKRYTDRLPRFFDADCVYGTWNA